MEIKKADSKGRVTVGIDGEIYSVVRHEDGTMTLNPVKIPEPPHMDNESLRAVYWEPAARKSQPDRIYIHSVIGYSDAKNAEWVASLANELKVPVVVKTGGVATAIADALVPIVDREVIMVRP